MRRKTVLEALLRLCGSKAIGSAGSPQVRAPPRLMAAGAVVGAAGFGGSVGLATGAAVGAAAGGAAGAHAVASTPRAPPATPRTKWRRVRMRPLGLERCIRFSPFMIG